MVSALRASGGMSRLSAPPRAATSVVRGLAAVALLALAAGCGSSLPIDAVAQPQAEIRAAEEAGASEVPEAALHLKMARDRLALGDQLASEGHDQQASRAYARAKSDAELSVLLAREAAISKKTKEAVDKTNALESAPPGAPAAR